MPACERAPWRHPVDQLAGIDGAGGDHAVKGRIDLFKRFQFAKSLHVGLCGTDGRRGGRSLIHEGVGVLAGDGIGSDESR